MAEKILLRVVTPVRPVLEEEVDEVTAWGALGQFTVLPNHIAFLTLLEIGELTYKQGAEKHSLALGGGYAEVLDNVMTVLTTSAEFGYEIDVVRARQAKEDAEKKMALLGTEDSEFLAADAALRQAQVRLQVAGHETRR